jgi:hypothetical protein
LDSKNTTCSVVLAGRPLLALAEALLTQLLHRLLELIAQYLPVLAQLTHLIALLALLAATQSRVGRREETKA